VILLDLPQGRPTIDPEWQNKHSMGHKQDLTRVIVLHIVSNYERIWTVNQPQKIHQRRGLA